MAERGKPDPARPRAPRGGAKGRTGATGRGSASRGGATGRGSAEAPARRRKPRAAGETSGPAGTGEAAPPAADPGSGDADWLGDAPAPAGFPAAGAPQDGGAAEGSPAVPVSPEALRPRAYAQDPLVAAASAVLAVSVFLPWYSHSGAGITATGWRTGTWAALVLFLGLASVALVAARRGGLEVTLPLEEPLVHEAAGWLAVIAVVVKARFAPIVGLLRLPPAWGLWLALGAGIVLALAAGRMSPQAPIVLRPGWYRGGSGRRGAAVLGVALLGAIVFGLLNDASPRQPLAGRPGGIEERLPANTVHGRLPDCAGDFPVPDGVEPEFGYEGEQASAVCVARLTADGSIEDVAKDYQAALRGAGWRFERTEQPGTFTILQLQEPECGTLYVAPGTGGARTSVSLVITACPSPAPSPPAGG